MTVYPSSPQLSVLCEPTRCFSRKSKVSVQNFAKPSAGNASLTRFLDSLPTILAANDLREVSAAIRRAKQKRKAILWGLGGHVIKVGLGPIVNDLMRRGFISALP